MFKISYLFLFLTLTIFLSACIGDVIEKPCRERILHPCAFSLIPELENEFIMENNNGDLLEFHTTSYSLDTHNTTGSALVQCISHIYLRARMRAGFNHVRIDYSKTTLFDGSDFEIQLSYDDSLSTYRGPFRTAYYTHTFMEDCTLAEIYYTDSVVVNNTVYRDVYKVEEKYWNDPRPLYETKARFRYLYFTKFGEILKFESETESFDLIN